MGTTGIATDMGMVGSTGIATGMGMVGSTIPTDMGMVGSTGITTGMGMVGSTIPTDMGMIGSTLPTGINTGFPTTMGINSTYPTGGISSSMDLNNDGFVTSGEMSRYNAGERRLNF